MKASEKLSKSDWLAIERTRLANERTFLAYFRTSLVFLGSGLSVLTIDFFVQIKYLGVILTALSPAILFVGIARLIQTRRKIQQFYGEPPQ